MIVWPFAVKDARQYQRPDQGFDIQADPGALVHAIAAGVVGLSNPDPGGFGNAYPYEVLDEDIGGPSIGVYYGHTEIRIAPGTHVNAGDVIAVTNVTNGELDNGASENGSAAPPGWLEIGFAVPGTGSPVQHGSGATGAGLRMRELLIAAAPISVTNYRPPRILFDAVTPENIPRDAEMVAGYIDGHEGVWTPEQWAYFPNAVKIRIATRADTDDGDALDVEGGDATPEQAPGWVAMRRRSTGRDKSVYMNESTWQSVKDAFARANEPEPQWWVAAVPGIGEAVYPGSIAHQFDSPGPFDRSYVAGFWSGVDTGGGPALDQRPKESEMYEVDTIAANDAFTGGKDIPAQGYRIYPTSPNLIAVKVSTDGGLGSEYARVASVIGAHGEGWHPLWVVVEVIAALHARFGRQPTQAEIEAAIDH